MILENKQRVFGLDIMRAIAILMVVFSHLLWIFPKNILSSLMIFSGYFGVEMFFVLSGFLIGKILYTLFLENSFSFSSIVFFIKRRWFRTIPNYFLVLILNIAVAFFIDYRIEQLWKYFFFLQNFSTQMPSFFPESWSLCIEEWAYLLLPIVLWVFYKIFNVSNKKSFFLKCIILLLIVFFITKMIYHFNLSQTGLLFWNNNLKTIVIYRIDAIFVGVLMSWLYYNFLLFWKKHKNKFAFFSFLIIIFLMIGSRKMRLSENQFFIDLLYLPLTSIAFALFLPMLMEFKTNSKFLYKSTITLSKISYSAYLVHYSIVLQLMNFFFKTTNLNLLEAVFFILSYFGLTFFLSCFLYKFFEKPMTNLREKRFF